MKRRQRLDVGHDWTDNPFVPRTAMGYDAFISYSHEADSRLAEELERALQRLAKPWHQKRAMDVFRDGGNLNLSGHLWGSIHSALDSSGFLIYLASEAAARSPWVAREIEYWKTHREVDRLIVVLTDGSMVWDTVRGDFDVQQSTAIPETILGAFAGEPLYLDMRWARAETGLSLEHDRFRQQVVQIAATLRGVAVEDIYGDEVEQHRRTIRVRNAAIAGLGTLAISALAFAGFAVLQRGAAIRSASEARSFAQQAEERRIRAEAAEASATESAALARKNAEVAARQEQLAKEEAHAARVALAASSVQESLRLLDLDRQNEALAHLARALRADPDSVAAQSWTSHFLLNETWWWPMTLPHADVLHASFSSDGRRIVTASRDGTARLWDAATGTPIGATLRHARAVNEAVFSADSSRVVTVSDDGTARVWDARSGRPVGAPMVHRSGVLHASFSRDGRRVLTAAAGDIGRVWDAESGEPIGTPVSLGDRVYRLALSADGQYAATTAIDGFKVWEAANGRPLPLDSFEGVRAGAVSPDGHRVAAALDKTVRVWDVMTGRPIGGPWQQQAGAIWDVRFSADGRRILVTSFAADTSFSAYETQTLDVSTGAIVGSTLRHVGTSAAFSADERFVVSANFSNVQVQEVATGRPVGARIRLPVSQSAASISPDGKLVMTVAGGMARVWLARKAPPAPPRVESRGDTVVAAAVTPDGRRIVTSLRGGATRAWDGVSGRQVGTPISFWDTATAVAVSPDGQRVLTGQASEFEDDTRIWDVMTGKPIGRPLVMGGAPVMAAAFSADGRTALTEADDFTIRRWDASTGAPRGKIVWYQDRPNPTPPRGAAFTPDGRFVVTAVDGSARLWNTGTGQPVGRRFQPHAILVAADVDPSGQVLASVSSAATNLWDIATGQAIGLPLHPGAQVTSVRFSADGRRVVTAAGDNTARLWDARTGRPVGPPLSHDGIFAALFTRDGRRVITASRSGTAHVWDVLLDLGASEKTDRLADLAELFGEYRVTDQGAVVPLDEPDRLLRLRRLAGPTTSGYVPLDLLLRPFIHAASR